MKNFTLKMLSLLFLGFTGINTNAQEWNFSTASFSALGTISTTTTVEGLTIVATADAVVAVDANNKSLDGMDFTSRLKLGGTGSFDAEGKPVSRVLSFPVSGNTKITVMGMSSSSSADRQLIIAAGLKDNIVGTFAALGTPITKGEFTYTGGATTIYLYSASSGVNLYYLKAAPDVSNNPQEWNMSTASFSGLGTLAATATVEGLTIFSTAEAAVAVDANNKSLDGMDFTSRIKLGGTGTFDAEGKPVSRVLAFNVGGNSTITVMGMSSSSTADRQLIVAAGGKDNIIGTFAALGASISKGEFAYKGEPTTIYLYSPSSGVNLYYIKTTPLVVGIQSQKIQELKVYPNPAKGRVYLNVNEPSQVGIFSIAGKLVKHQQVNQSQNSIDISDLRAGIYFVRMMNNANNAQKLIIR
ncbi:MAG: hypothetical protein A2066_20040 [Bacteroidetes bacterium GWB2_41_8]|nr:MAG: hypothetical protein A2066_20040 [Bacteroidetes bacterium GWB2_41_8]